VGRTGCADSWSRGQGEGAFCQLHVRPTFGLPPHPLPFPRRLLRARQHPGTLLPTCSFDLLHVLLDETTEYMDERIAAHIVALHTAPNQTLANAAPYTREEVQRYIRYARAIRPVISEEVRLGLCLRCLGGPGGMEGSSEQCWLWVPLPIRLIELHLMQGLMFGRAYATQRVLSSRRHQLAQSHCCPAAQSVWAIERLKPTPVSSSAPSALQHAAPQALPHLPSLLEPSHSQPAPNRCRPSRRG
jgi:hypothetical protein